MAEQTIHLVTLLETSTPIVREAGAMLKAEYFRPGGPRGAGSHADIDEEIEAFLKTRLTAIFPGRFVGEELGSFEGTLEEYTWLVDPNDGTSHFLKGRKGSAVSVGLLRRGVPVLGMVFAPVSPDRGEDFISWAEGLSHPLRNGRPCDTNPQPGLTGDSVVFMSPDAARNPVVNGKLCRPGRFMVLPSIAYRLARVAAGDGVATVSINSPQGHDYAAGHALLRGAGTQLLDETGEVVTYSTEGVSSVGMCAGGHPDTCRTLLHRLTNDGLEFWGSGVAPARLPKASVARREDPRLARAQGVLLGQVIGDSLGSLVEFESADEIRVKYPVGLSELKNGGTWNTLAGQPTDDSEMAWALARCLATRGDYDPDAVANAYGAWLRSDPFDIGNTTIAALLPLQKGPMEKASEAVHRAALPASQANGSLMRVSPLGIRFAGDPATAARWARIDASLTHPHAICQGSAAAFSAAIANGVAGGDHKSMIHGALSVLGGTAEDREVARVITDACRFRLPDLAPDKMGWVLGALQVAFYHLAKKTPPGIAIPETVALGGDTDTNGAIAGALVGALHGSPAFPHRWVMPVLTCRPMAGMATHARPMDYWPDDVLELAEALLPTLNN